MKSTRWAERLMCVAVGAGVCWLLHHEPLSGSLDDSIRRLHGRQWIVVGYDPGLESLGTQQQGSRGVRGEAAENWMVVTYRTPEEVRAAVGKVSMLPAR